MFDTFKSTNPIRNRAKEKREEKRRGTENGDRNVYMKIVWVQSCRVVANSGEIVDESRQ
jgi:hypothetical protein